MERGVNPHNRCQSQGMFRTEVVQIKSFYTHFNSGWGLRFEGGFRSGGRSKKLTLLQTEIERSL